MIKVEVKLKTACWVDGKMRKAGETVFVDPKLAKSFEGKPKATSKPKTEPINPAAETPAEADITTSEE